MNTEELAKIAKALADPTRLRIYGHIASCGETFCGELVEREHLTPGTVSHHLKILAEAGLIESRREGQFIYNRPHCEALKCFTTALAKLARPSKAGKK